MKQEPVLGQLITDDNAERDAFHVAVHPVIAREDMDPGEFIYVINSVGGTFDAYLSDSKDRAVGIVDPLLDHRVYIGDKFYCWIKPNTVTGMKHHWEHPAFPDVDNSQKEFNPSSAEKEIHRQWLEHFCEEWSFDFDNIVDAAINQGYITSYGNEYTADDLGDDWDLFWEHLEIYAGRKFPESHRQHVGWSCSC